MSFLLSHKFEIIKQFLEDVVKVVPFESIAYAIANGNYQTAMQCSEALMAHSDKIPKTFLMANGLSEAVYRLDNGVPKTRQKRPSISSGGMPMDSGKLLYEHNTVQLGTQSTKSPCVKVNKKIADDLHRIRLKWFGTKLTDLEVDGIDLVSTTNIEDLYPFHTDGSSDLNSPLSILVTGRKQLEELSIKSSESNSSQQMLSTVNKIRDNELDTCTSLLGGFMHQGFVNIILSSNKTSKNSPSGLFVNGAASVGVWALFSLDYSHVQPILAKCQGEQLLVKLFKHVKGISGFSHAPDENEINPYAAKLQFMAQGMAKTVTCNTQHVSYSLERQLVDLCKERGITAATPLSAITGKWSALFRENILSLVHYKCRLLIARWLKWALMIHNLREELAKYTVVGVVGLVNSGKSKLINTLFGIEVGL